MNSKKTVTSAPQKYKIKNTKDRRIDDASSTRDIDIDADRLKRYLSGDGE